MKNIHKTLRNTGNQLVYLPIMIIFAVEFLIIKSGDNT